MAGFHKADLSEAALGEVINLGTGYEISIGALAETIARAVGVAIEIETESQRVRRSGSEVERLCADAAKAGRLLGWTPEHGGPDGLLRGLERTIAWFRRNDRTSAERAREYSQ